ncbi:MAG TPA: SusC/RagA family TonB-linked outer membrane protein [Chryseolinea sp.]|nr:SusC/RagA family TonB-linked outer membrane protein [Chryseolinea sp.]
MKKNLREFYLRVKFLGVTVILAIMLLAGHPVFCQELAVSGQVREAGNPLPGVSILEKGTSKGTTSDAQGNFNLTVGSPTAVLVFSFIGYKTQEVAVANRTSFDVDMEEDITALSEVVVTALGVQKEVKSLGYAVQKVDGASSTKAREPNIMNSLTGKVAGLQVNNQTDLFQNPEILLRGAKPLIVIDGVPNIEGDLWKINADDIESYNVLKGATASALYGSIGRNGAIMITTKRGSGKNALSVEVNSSTMFQPNFIRIPDVQTTYGNGNNGQYAYVDGSGSGLEGSGWIWGPKLNQPDPSTPSGYWETTQFNSPVDPATGELVPLPFLSRGADNVKNFFQTGVISSNNISVSGGSENGTFRVSASNTYQKGIVPNTQLNNTSFAVSGGYKLSKNLKTDASLTYNRQYTDNFPEVGYGPENYLYNLVLWTGPDVDVRDLRDYWKKGQENIQQRHYNTSWYNNPYFQAYEFLQGYYRDNVFGQLKLDYNILPGLDLTLRTGFNQFSLNRDWKTPKSYLRYDIFSKGNLQLRSQNELSINTDFIAQYSKKISENFTIRASIGGANRWRTYRIQDMQTDGLVIPGFYNVSNSQNPVRGTNSLEEEKVNSVYGTLDAELFGGIFLGVTGRNDWVSTLPVKNNSFFYPSVSLSAVLSDFIDVTSLNISFLKLRSSWSRVSDGKIKNPKDPTSTSTYPYYHIQAYDPGVNWNNTPSLSYPRILINPDLHPETSDTYELGLDTRFLEGRLGLDVALYRIRDFNNLNVVPISEGTGYTARLENGGEFIRKGIEITLTATPVKSGAFSWDVVVNWSQFRKYLESVYGGATKLNNIPVGTRNDALYGFSYMHTPGGKLVLQDNGFPQNDPYVRKLGYSDPDFIFGFLNTFNYKNFSLTVSADGRIGGTMYSTTNQKMWWGGTHPGTVNEYREAANEGRSTYVADGVVVVEGDVQYDSDGKIISDTRVYAPNTTPVNYISWNVNTSNAFLNHYYDASFVKLREITLTYNFSSAVLSKTFLEKASISFVGRNLFLWSDMKEVDPDPGRDNLQTPSTRSIGFNVDFTF